MKKIGADQIIFPEIDMGEKLARSIAGSNLLQFFHFSDNYSMLELKAFDDIVGKTLSEIDFRKKYKIEFNLISDKNLILPEYKINLLNKNKKIITKIENYQKIEKNFIKSNYKKKEFTNKKYNKTKKKIDNKVSVRY